MARHLPSCEARAEAVRAADQAPGEDHPLLHLQVQDAWDGDYWLQLEMDGTATLKHLDQYLRAIWLECCGHLSQFTTDGWGGKVAFGRKAADVLQPGSELTHIYDFGTESVTLIRAIAARAGKRTSPHPIALMARNATPLYPCQECGAAATHLCQECQYEDEQPGLLCDAHVEGHPHVDYGEPFPLVNSPRIGLCGYAGPAEPPY